MSYSFSAKGATAALARAAAEAEIDKILGYQPVHAKDKEAILANIDAVTSLLAEDANKDVQINCNGYLCWSGVVDGHETFTSAAINCYASVVDRTVPA
jgi:hypothetical protein